MPADTTTTTVAETTPTVTTTTVATTIESPAPEPTAGPAARNAPFAAASALTGRSLTITDPFSVSPATLAFGSFAVGSTASEVVTIVNTTGREVFVEVYGVAGVSVTGIAGCGNFVPPANVVASLYLDVDQTCDIYVSIDTSAIGAVNGQLILTDTDSGSIAFVRRDRRRGARSTPGQRRLGERPGPVVADHPRVRWRTRCLPRNRAATRHRGSARFDRVRHVRTGRVRPGPTWRIALVQYTSPPGLRGTSRVRAPRPDSSCSRRPTTPRPAESQRAKGNTLPPSSIQFVRMEPGHTVWFSVFNESPFIDPGRFTLELFQAPDEQDPIVEAYGGAGTGEFALSTDFNLSGGGDTYHLTPDLPGGEPDGWWTLRFAVPGTLSVTYRSATARTLGPFEADEGSERPLGLRIYRSPSPPGWTTRPYSPRSAWGPAPSATRRMAHLRLEVGDDRHRGGDTWPLLLDLRGGGGRPDVLHLRCAIPGLERDRHRTPDRDHHHTARWRPVRRRCRSVECGRHCTDNRARRLVRHRRRGPDHVAGDPPGSHTVSLECTDSAGNMSSVTSTYTVTAPPTGPCVIVDTQSVDFGDVAVGSTAPPGRSSCGPAPTRRSEWR